MRALIVDDEDPPRERIRSLLAERNDVRIVGEARDGREAVERIRELRPELLFLDVQMPGLSGFEVLEELGAQAPPAVIFVTAYDEYAIQAFDQNAVDYLLKPIQPARFDVALKRAAERLAKPPVPRRFAVRIGGRIRLVNDDDVDWMESAGNYVRLHTAKERLPLRASMKELEAALDPARFARIHRTMIVRLASVVQIEPQGDGEYLVVLTNGARLRSSRRYGERLRSL